MMIARIQLAIVAACAALAPCLAAAAAQHLVSPGDNWSGITSKVMPGDEILLLPGRHRNALLLDLAGTAQAPIIIRSADPKRPAIITEHREGLRLVDVEHVRIRDLTVADSTLNGIAIVDRAAHLSPLAAPAKERDPGSRHITLERITIQRTGPTGLRHALLLHNAADVTIRDCTIEGWGGSAVEIAASRDITITDCRFKGMDDYSQIAGVRVRAGSQKVHIDHCRFSKLSAACCFGAASEPEDWRTPESQAEVAAAGEDRARPGPSTQPRDDEGATRSAAKAEPAAEVSDSIMERCLVEDVTRPIVLQGVASCIVRNNTFAGVQRTIIVVLPPGDIATERGDDFTMVSSNIFTWSPGALDTLAEFEARKPHRLIVIGRNLWWSSEDAEARAKLGSLPGLVEPNQEFAVDPKLDRNRKAMNPKADLFGVHAP